MDNPFPSSPAALMQVQRAAAEHREAGEASQEAFERQLANAGEPHEATEAVRQTPPPEPPANIQSVIERAVQAERTRRNLSQRTARGYTEVLFRLQKDLRSRGKTIAALDHDALVAHAAKFMARDKAMGPALTALHRYRNPNAPDGPRRRYVVPSVKEPSPVNAAVPSADIYPHLSETDRTLIDNFTRFVGGGLQKSTIYEYGRSLRILGNDLGTQGKTIGGLDHEALVSHARVSLGEPAHLLSALSALRKYREPDQVRQYFLSEEDESLIDGAVQAAAARRTWIPNRIETYYRAFHRLAKSLKARGLTIAALDHHALLAHAKAAHEGDEQISSALEVLLEYRDPAILERRTPLDYPPSAKDKSLIEDAAAVSKRPRKAVEASVKNLLKFAGALAARSLEIDQLGHIALLELANKLFPSNKSLIRGLGMIREYRNAERTSGADGAALADDVLACSPILSVDPEELRRLLDDEPTFSQTIDNLAERQDDMAPVDQLPTESLDTAELMGMLASPGHSPEDEVTQPDPVGPRLSDAVDPGDIWSGAEQAGLLPTESLDTAKLLEMIASGGHSPTDSVNQPGATVPSLHQNVDPDSIWLEAEQAGRLPTQSLDTAELLQMFAFAGHSPADSVNQPSSMSSWDLENSTADAAFQPAQSQPMVPALELYLPQGWEHGEQWASEDFKEGMRLHGVLPNEIRPETTLTIRGLDYIASIGPPGLEQEVFLRRA
ncbi:hypothetical protein [Bradyrhizobium tropiciagri]|uniref:hypothetical protein n=1 Tax=Bradyrhizobium tropiciagri TaxID=312253 RepID=UPI001009C0E8|nr:hypothetical protein [Bradyrhizobium tropiciagri]